MDTIQAGGLRLAENDGHHLVGQQHALLNQLVCLLLLAFLNPQDLAGFIEHAFDLVRIQVDRTFFKALPAQCLGQGSNPAQGLLHILGNALVLPGIKEVLGLLVMHPAIGMNDGLVRVVVLDAPALIEFNHNRVREAVLVGP